MKTLNEINKEIDTILAALDELLGIERHKNYINLTKIDLFYEAFKDQD